MRGEAAPQYLRHLMKMFVADFETAVSKRFDVKFWNKLKSMMDEITKAMENDRLVNHNVQNLAIGFLTDLSLLVHYHYEIPNYGNDISKQLTWTPDVFLNRKPIKSKKNSRVFMAYVLLRMGDLMRYKENYPKAQEYYEQSCRINPADGAVWNQLGLISSLGAKNLESVYFHTRALHATMEFPTASGGLTNIFKNFANRDISRPMPIKDLYLSCLGRIHFLLEIEDSSVHLQKIGEEAATSKEMIVPLMSVYKHLEDGTELEQRAVEYVKTIWCTAYRSLLKTLDDYKEESKKLADVPHLLHILALLLCAPKLLRGIEDQTEDEVTSICEWLLCANCDEKIKDSDAFGYFHCLQRIQYPLTRTQLAQKLVEIEDEDESKDSDQSTIPEEDQKSLSTDTSRIQNEDSEPESESESSDEEVLQRGRRRGRNPNLDESVETDEDEF